MAELFDPFHGRIPFKEDIRSQSFSFSGNSFVLRRAFQCRWKDQFKFCQAMLGRTVIGSKDSFYPQLLRQTAIVHPALKDPRSPHEARAFLYPVGVESVEGLGPTPKRLLASSPDVDGDRTWRDNRPNRWRDEDVYRRARVTIQYDSPTYPVRMDAETPLYQFRRKEIPATQTFNPPFSGENKRSEWRRYTTKIVQPHTEAIRLPVGHYKWAEGLERDGAVVSVPRDVDVNIGTFRLLPSQEVTYIFHQVPAVLQPWEGRLAGDGNTNSDVDGQAAWKYKEPAPAGAGVMPELLGAVYTHIGCVNARWFDGYPPGTLLLTAVEARPYKWVTGERYYDYTYRMKFFNPPDVLPLNSRVIAVANGEGWPSRDGLLASYLGHNYYLRFTPPSADGDGGVKVEPFFSLITHNGKPLEEKGQPVFMYRDFEDLFVPYNRAHMAGYYSKVTLLPRWHQP